jgi:hypothetical protein
MQKRRHEAGGGRACGGLTGSGLGLALLGLELFEDALRQVGARLLRSLHVRRCRLELHPDRAKCLLEACVLHTHTHTHMPPKFSTTRQAFPPSERDKTNAEVYWGVLVWRRDHSLPPFLHPFLPPEQSPVSPQSESTGNLYGIANGHNRCAQLIVTAVSHF